MEHIGTILRRLIRAAAKRRARRLIAEARWILESVQSVEYDEELSRLTDETLEMEERLTS